MTKTINKNRLFNIIFVSIIAVLIFAVRLYMLLKSKHPTGLDGYFYALQAKSLIVNGSLENPDHELGYFFCGFFSWLFNDAILGCKIWAALSSALISVNIYILLKNISKDKTYIPIAGLLISASCVSLTLFNINFINNQTGLVFFLSYCTALISFLKKQFITNKQKIFSLILCIILLICSALCHLVSAAYAFIFTAVLFIRKMKLKNQLILIAVSLVLGLLLFFNQLPRFASVFNFGPVLPIFSKQMCMLAGYPVCIEITSYFVTTWILAIIYCCISKKFDFLVLLVPVLFFPFWKLDILDMGYRMLLNAVPCAIVLNLYFLDKLLNTYSNSLIYKNVFGIIFIINFAALFNTPKLYNPRKDPPFDYYKTVVEQIDLDDDSLLIAHLPINHVYTYYCNLRDGLNYEVDFYVPEGKTWRLAYGTNADYLKQFFGEFEEDELCDLIKQLSPEYTLIREDLWQRYLKYEEDEIVDSLKNFYNPHTYRPEFIRKKSLD